MQIGGGEWRKMNSMTDKLKPRPFSPGGGHLPLKLAGREEETDQLAEILDALLGERAEGERRLRLPPSAPIKIVGPRGVGKTALLNWTKRQARERGVRFVSCEGLRPNEADFSMRKLLGDISFFQRAFGWIKGFSLSAAAKFGAGVELNQATAAFTGVAGGAVRRRPLLLVMDEVQHYDLALLRAVLQGSQKLIGEGYPLGLVLAGTPGLDSHLAKAESTFIVRCDKIYINTLSDAATREALAEPFRQIGVAVAPDALEAMATQTDNYPYFIQFVGREVWRAMTKAGRKDVDAGLVRQIEEQARKGRRSIYTQAYDRLDGNDLLPYACQVMELLDGNGGKASAGAIIKLLMDANPGVDRQRARDIRDGLREDGFIWTVDDETAPGIPSFFNYFRARQQEEAG